MLQCTVCSERESKYKCPACRAQYCSLPCFRKHKEALCSSPSPSSAQDPPVTNNAVETIQSDLRVDRTLVSQESPNEYIKEILQCIPEERRLNQTSLRRLEESKEIKDVVADIELKNMLTSVINSPSRLDAHSQIRFLLSSEPKFADFSTRCLDVVNHSSNEGS